MKKDPNKVKNVLTITQIAPIVAENGQVVILGLAKDSGIYVYNAKKQKWEKFKN